MGIVEKAVILVADGVLGNPVAKAGQYQSLDILAKRSQSGYLSTFSDCNDTITQLTGVNYHTVDFILKDYGPMKISILKKKSTYNSSLGNVEEINDLSEDQIFQKIDDKLKEYSVIVVEISTLNELDHIVSKLLPKIDADNVGVCVICGYAKDATLPNFTVPPPVVDPSWKVIGPDVVDKLSLEHPFLFFSASKNLTRIDKVQAFDEKDFENNNCMGILPICQLFREYSYYTGSSWKYGA
ncbi:hypothetical protein GPJ56_008778 [Histomonas meleagridis]|uniref:uncharacterized protein n=1 Tax=Histomonas meleagridis TaxID=135588 RepID=UPI00355A4C79|nr:hypothetical protein GPJ56_008778 [Histomonas meleagridis]KAH0805430.1 hypothetical protein GO595_001812 [Histomonas meleagridis]